MGLVGKTDLHVALVDGTDTHVALVGKTDTYMSTLRKLGKLTGGTFCLFPSHVAVHRTI